MNSLMAFVALLVLSYLGGLLSGHKISRWLGFSSGVEYVLLGIIVGPHALGFFRHETVVGFEPLLLMALGWLAAILGVQYGRYAGQRVPVRILALGWLSATLTGGGVFFFSYMAARKWLPEQVVLAKLFALAVAAVASGSAHQAVRWATGGQSRERSVSSLLGGIGSGDDLPPLLMLAALAYFTPGAVHPPFPNWGTPLLGLGLGVVLGATVAALLGSTLHRAELWPVLLGAVLLVVGLALRLGLPLLTPAFLVGSTLSFLSPHRRIIYDLVVETERPLLVPTLLLAGALVELPRSLFEWKLLGVALVTRLVLQFGFGMALAQALGLRVRRIVFGQALLSTGGASLMIALTVYFRHPGELGRLVLCIAVGATFLGELLGGRALRKVASQEQLAQPLAIEEAS